MIQLLDVNPVSKGVATIFADTKAEVPETAAALFAALEPNEWTKKLNPGLAAGTIIITSTFDVAFVRSDGLIQWKGEEPPTPPAEPVTVTISDPNSLIESCTAAYVNAEGVLTSGALTRANNAYTFETMPESTVIIAPYQVNSGVHVTSECDLEETDSDEFGNPVVYAIITGDAPTFTITSNE